MKVVLVSSYFLHKIVSLLQFFHHLLSASQILVIKGMQSHIHQGGGRSLQHKSKRGLASEVRMSCGSLWMQAKFFSTLSLPLCYYGRASRAGSKSLAGLSWATSGYCLYTTPGKYKSGDRVLVWYGCATLESPGTLVNLDRLEKERKDFMRSIHKQSMKSSGCKQEENSNQVAKAN